MADHGNDDGDLVMALTRLKRVRGKAVALLARMKAESMHELGPWPLEAEVLCLELTGKPSEALEDRIRDGARADND